MTMGDDVDQTVPEETSDQDLKWLPGSVRLNI